MYLTDDMKIKTQTFITIVSKFYMTHGWSWPSHGFNIFPSEDEIRAVVDRLLHWCHDELEASPELRRTTHHFDRIYVTMKGTRGTDVTFTVDIL